MIKVIKKGNNIGVAKQVQGIQVIVEPHQRYKGLYRFKYNGEWWMCSDYAFENLNKKN